MSGVILPLEVIAADHHGMVGAKMLRLAQLARHGFSVPTGFVVTTEAFRRHMAQPAIEQAIIAHLRDLDEADIAGAKRASAGISAAIMSGSVDGAVLAQIVGAYDALCRSLGTADVATAVRSSATGEDAADASFAGQYESFLGIAGADAVVEAVKGVWASLFSDRALLYRKRRNLEHWQTPIAVGVIHLVDAKSAGVAFSIHPTTGRGDRIVVEANWGWGEAVVQGLVSPDHVEIDKEEMRLLDYRVADKRVMSTFDAAAGRVVEQPMSDARRLVPVLTPEEAIAIARIVVELERISGHAVDVEWVIDRARAPAAPVMLVQYRPVTRTGDGRLPAWDPRAIALRFIRPTTTEALAP